MSYFILFICGILTALPYIFDFMFFLPYFTIAPLFIISLKNKNTYRQGLSFSMGYYLVVYHWFFYLYPLDFAGFDTFSSIVVVLIAWFGLSLLQAIGTSFIPVIYRLLCKNRNWIFGVFAGASIWCITEWAQNLFWFGVPWARLAVTQHKILPIIQSASVFGSLGVGFIIVVISGFLAKAYLDFKENKEIKLHIILAASVFAVNFIFGVITLSLPKITEKHITAAAIQGNISSSDKWADDSVEASLEKYTTLTINAVNDGAKLVVWPETVLVCDLNLFDDICDEISELSRELNCYIAVGAFYLEGDDDYNAIYLFEPDGKMNENVYKKRHLVPFGEYLPMSELLYTVFPVLKNIIMLEQPLTAGSSSELFKTDIGTLGGLVCFDSIYDALSLQSVRDGAELLILSTNDSWYKDSSGVRQHNGHAVLRAVENGRYIIRSANTGISSLITDKGKILSDIPALEEGYITSEISLKNNRTVYSYTGNLIVILSVLYLIFLAFYEIFKENSKKRIELCEKQ